MKEVGDFDSNRDKKILPKIFVATVFKLIFTELSKIIRDLLIFIFCLIVSHVSLSLLCYNVLKTLDDQNRLFSEPLLNISVETNIIV